MNPEVQTPNVSAPLRVKVRPVSRKVERVLSDNQDAEINEPISDAELPEDVRVEVKPVVRTIVRQRNTISKWKQMASSDLRDPKKKDLAGRLRKPSFYR